MTSPGRFPKDSRETPDDLTVVQGLRATAQLAARRRDEDPAWGQLEDEIQLLLRQLGVDDSVPAGGIGTGTVDRAQLASSRSELLAALAALEREPSLDRARSTRVQLTTIRRAAD